MKRSIALLRKTLALLVGVPIVIIGIILIPLPGPGILITVLGLYIISLEFDAAKPYLDKLKARLQAVINSAKNK